MKADRRTAILAAVVLLAVGGLAYWLGHQNTTPAAAAPAAPTTATLTVIGATATVYGAVATRTVTGQPMPLSELTNTVVVVIEATDGLGSCEIDAGGVRVAYASTPRGQQAVCIWNRLAPTS